MKTIYFAGGCFWGSERYFRMIPGVVDVECGYVQGRVVTAPTYEEVCSGSTGCREAVKVDYDPERISLDALILAFFEIIDPTMSHRQGNDIGEQYQTGIYYTSPEDGERVDIIMNIERSLYKHFAVESGKLTSYYTAEEYHQRYLEKNPGGYCHITQDKFDELAKVIEEAQQTGTPIDVAIKDAFALEAYKVTQQNATEPPFTNEFASTEKRGLYVDITTGEPLFKSDDKFISSCGWPAFSRAIDESAIAEKDDFSHGMHRPEVRSTKGDAHLGHVFENDLESPTSTRYCINSAALRFIPYENLIEEGYGHYRSLFD